MKRFLTPVAIAGLVAIALTGTSAIATHDPANKPAASGARADLEFLNEGQEELVLSEHIKTSNPTDLILQLTSECSIFTQLATVGNQSSRAVGQLRFRVEIDGVPVPVSQDDPENGSVVFCDRAHQQEFTNLDDNDARLEQYLRTRTSNAFNWLALNVGSGEHDIEVFATFDRETNEGDTPAGENMSSGAVGARSLIIEPVKAANDEVVTETSERG